MRPTKRRNSRERRALASHDDEVTVQIGKTTDRYVRAIAFPDAGGARAFAFVRAYVHSRATMWEGRLHNHAVSYAINARAIVPNCVTKCIRRSGRASGTRDTAIGEVL